MMRHVQVALFVLILIGAHAMPSTAAIVTVNPGGKNEIGEPYLADTVSDILISGEIRSGDAERVVSAIFSLPRRRTPPSFILNSGGGDVLEAIKLAKLLNTLRAPVAVYNHYELIANSSAYHPAVCASSCFILYAAAGRRTLIPEMGKVGVHRPYLSQYPGSVNQELKIHREIIRRLDELLGEFGVSRQLIDKMKSLPSNEIHWLTRNELESLGVMPPAIEEMAIRECGFDRSLVANMRLSESQLSQLKDSMTCLNKFMAPEIDDAINKLRRGWRPWSD